MSRLRRGLRIMQICTSRSWGGMEMHLGILSERLRERGHHIIPVCYADSRIQKDLVDKGFQPHNLNLKHYFHPRDIWQLIQMINAFSIDLIHSHYSRDLWTIVPALKWSRKVPVVFIKHIGTQKPKRDFLHRWIYKNVSYVIAISEVIKRNLLDTHPLSPDKVGVVHHGVDLKRYDPRNVNRELVRGELGINEDEVVVGIISRLQVAKGYLEFLEMARRISEIQSGVRFLMVGEASRGEEDQARMILNQVNELGLSERVIHAGFRSDIHQILAAMDIFVFPARAEAFGLVLIEAMAMALPVVACHSDGVLDIVCHNETGYLVPPENVDQLTEAVLTLIHDKHKRFSLGQQGRIRVQEKFDVNRMVDQVETIYEQILE